MGGGLSVEEAVKAMALWPRISAQEACDNIRTHLGTYRKENNMSEIKYCIIKKCDNTSEQGTFVHDMCEPHFLEISKIYKKPLKNLQLTSAEKSLSDSEFDLNDYDERLRGKIESIVNIAGQAALQYGNTYRQGGAFMRFSDIFRKYKRLEKEYIEGLPRKREKTTDDLKDLAVYSIVMWIYLDELQLHKKNIAAVPEFVGDEQ